MSEPRSDTLIFEGAMYKILLKRDSKTKEGHYLIIPPGEKSTLLEGIDKQREFFKKIICEYLAEVEQKIKDNYVKRKSGEYKGLRMGVNFGSAGKGKATPHIHFFPIVKGEKFKYQFKDQEVEKE
jgi:hypothetical protein